jgi:glycosyltransferase involved in cell wall biosynthesis
MTSPERQPRVTVLLPVYNGEKYVAEAIDSVLGQTFTDFELLVIDDGSNDHTPGIVAGFGDRRLRLIRFPENRGLVAALNAGIQASECELIASMHADDISLPTRLEKQVDFLDTHGEVAICGTWTREFGARQNNRCPPVEPQQIRVRLLFAGWAMDHPTFMVRRSFLERNSLLYRQECHLVEDLDLLLRAAELTQLANLPEVLQLYRVHEEQLTALHHQYVIGATDRLLARQLRLLLPEMNPTEEAFHTLVNRELVPESELRRAGRWLERLRAENRRTARYDRNAFESELRQKWQRIFGIYDDIGWWSPTVLMSYWGSPLSWSQGPQRIDWRRQKTRFDECLAPPLRRAGWTLR